MAYESLLTPNEIFGVDVGATNIKFSHVDVSGNLMRSLRRRPTPYPCTPERLVGFVEERVARSGCNRVGLGFPGEYRDGRVVHPGNLSRPGGAATPKDPDLEARWRGFALEDVLRQVSGRDVRVVNDATLAALGCVEGHGVELVLTLGTGLGLALAKDGVLQRVRDVGAEIYENGKSYDETIGERARSLDEENWNPTLVDVTTKFAAEFNADVVHLAGGNARRVMVSEFVSASFRLVINGNESSMRGVARLFDDSVRAPA